MAPFHRHRGPITSVAAIPNQRAVVTGGYDSAVALFSFEERRVDLLGYHEHLVNSVIVDDSGRWAASCSSDYTIGLWDLEQRELIRILRGHADDVEAFVFVDEQIGVSASRDHRILVWDLSTGSIEHVFDAHERDVLSLAHRGTRLYSSGDDKTLRIWDLKDCSLVQTIGPFELETDTCAIDAARGRIVLGCDDGCVRIFNVEDGGEVATLDAHASGIKKVAVSPRGDLLSAAYDQKIILWDGDTLTQKRLLEAASHKWERSFGFSQNGDRVVAGTFDGTVIEWDAGSGSRLAEFGADGEGNACFNRVASAPSGAAVAVSDDGWVRLASVSASNVQLVSQVKPKTGRVLMNGVALSERAGLVAAGAHDQHLHLYDVVDGQLVNPRHVYLGEGPINFISIGMTDGTADDSFVGCYSGCIVRVNRAAEVIDKWRIHEGAIKSVKLHPHEDLGVSCSADGEIRSWRFDGRLENDYRGHVAITNDVDLDASGERLASVSRDFTLKVFDVNTGRLEYSRSLGFRSLKSVCFVSSECIIVGDYWGGLFRVDPVRDAVDRLRVAANGISSLASAGELVVAVSYDGSIYAIDPRPFEVVQRLEVMRQRLAATQPRHRSILRSEAVSL